MSLRETINSTTLGDRLLLILLIFISLSGIFFIKEVLPKPEDVSVEINGKPTYRYPLDADRLLYVEGPYGHLTVEVKNKEVRVVNATCPNKLCEHQGWITRGAIICLPNRISVIVGGSWDSGDKSVDAITG